MKKIIVIITIGVFALIGCSPKEQSTEQIRNQIVEYKMQIEDLNGKISELENSIKDDSTKNNSLKVEILTVGTKNFEHHIDVTGTIDADLHALISPEMNGQITKIYVKEGQKVNKGQILAKLNDEVLRNNLVQLQTGLLLADTLYQKKKKLYEQKVISEIEYLQAKNQKESLEDNINVIKSQIRLTTIVAPFSGIVDRIYLKEGEMGVPGRTFIQMVNLSQMIATADVPENYLPDLKIGDQVKLTFPTYPDLEITNTIYQIGNVIDPNNRTFRVKILFSNKESKIKPNMISIIRFQDFNAENAIVVPTNSLSQDISGWFLFVVENKENKNIAVKKYVQIGISNEKETIITSGLSEGDKIISKGQNLVKDGMEVSI
ncbi:MAG: efflux RND transporter periplasmic adaptor subunit [Bacteroidales bacterium]|nr:efflux RND transporter periplasmic adaptor subunit [Bacteroidales bacterium]